MSLLKRLKAVWQLFFDKVELERGMVNTVALKNNYGRRAPESLIRITAIYRTGMAHSPVLRKI